MQDSRTKNMQNWTYGIVNFQNNYVRLNSVNAPRLLFTHCNFAGLQGSRGHENIFVSILLD